MGNKEREIERIKIRTYILYLEERGYGVWRRDIPIKTLIREAREAELRK